MIQFILIYDIKFYSLLLFLLKHFRTVFVLFKYMCDDSMTTLISHK